MITILVLVLTLALSWLLSCGVFWLLCWALGVFGITTIFGWTVGFSWLAATAFWIIYLVIKSIFNVTISSGK